MNTVNKWVQTGARYTLECCCRVLSTTPIPIDHGGKFGYGDKRFPKDVNAFAKMTAGTSLGTLLEHLYELNVHFRGLEEHI